jgi:hypothetical protein
VTLHPVNDQKLSFLRLVSGSDELYAIVDTHAQGCGCEDRTDRFDRDVSVKRFSWDTLNGAGTEMFTVQGPLYLDNIVPSSAGLYATGEEKVGAGEALFRLDASGAHKVRTVPTNPYFSIAPISPAS